MVEARGRHGLSLALGVTARWCGAVVVLLATAATVFRVRTAG
ncbi:hypothetical protein [Microbacterium sp. LWH3-1.2]